MGLNSVKDDDFLVEPQIIRNMHQAFLQLPMSPSLHLQPAYEHLISRLQKFTSQDQSINTVFAWLGYGSYLRRNLVNEFLKLLQELHFTEEEMRMADNYFTILANRPKDRELWLSRGIELGGGEPFTVGAAGEERNNLHIVSAKIILQFLRCTKYARNVLLNILRRLHRIKLSKIFMQTLLL